MGSEGYRLEEETVAGDFRMWPIRNWSDGPTMSLHGVNAEGCIEPQRPLLTHKRVRREPSLDAGSKTGDVYFEVR